jgi:hypothetical protein
VSGMGRHLALFVVFHLEKCLFWHATSEARGLVECWLWERIKVLARILNVRPSMMHTPTPIPDGATMEFLLSNDHSSWHEEVV